MPTHLTTTTSPDATSVLQTWLNKKFVRDLEWQLQHQKFTTKAVIPENAGNVGRFIAFAPPTKPSSYSTSGATAFIPEGSVSSNEITAVTQSSTNITIAEFGEFTKVGTLYEYAAVAGTREELVKRLRDGAAFSIDTFVRSKAVTTTNSFFATNNPGGGLTTSPATTPLLLGAAALMSARKLLYDVGAMGFDNVPDHPTGHYAAVITPKQELDIITEISTTRVYWSNAVVNVPGKMGQDKFVNGYIGSVYGVAVYCTNNYTTFNMTGSAEIGFVYADGGVGAMAFKDMKPEIVINDVNSPYKNMNSIAWHSFFGAGLIDGNRVVKLYSNSA